MSPQPAFNLDVLAKLKAALKADPHSVIDKAGKDVFIACAPGRLDIMGGLASSTGAVACALPLPLGAAVAVQRRDDRKLILSTYNSAAVPPGGGAPSSARVEMSLEDFYGTGAMMPLEAIQALFAGPRHWAAHLAGAYWTLGKHRKLTRRVTGANIACLSDIPLGVGLGSSAALQVAGLIALTAAYHLILDPLEIAVLAHSIEHQIVGLPGSPAEPLASALGHAGQLILANCQPHSVEGFLDLPPGVLLAALVPAPPATPPNTPAYGQAVTAGAMAQVLITRAFKDLGVKTDPTEGYLANLKPELYRMYLRPILPRRLSGRDFLTQYPGTLDRTIAVQPDTLYALRSAADHHVFESARVGTLIAALQHGSPRALRQAGRLLRMSHESLIHRAGLPAEQGHNLVLAISAFGPAHGLYGARASGHTAGALAILAADTREVRGILQNLADRLPRSTGQKPQLILARPTASPAPAAAETTPQKVPAVALVT